MSESGDIAQSVLDRYGTSNKPIAAPSSDTSAPTAAAILKKYGSSVPSQSAPIEQPSVLPEGSKLPAPIKASIGYNDQILQGMPIIAPLMDKATAAIGAGIQGLLGRGDKSYGERYSSNLADLQSRSAEFSASHPIGSTFANLIGGGMALGPVAATNVGGTLLGTYGPSLGSRVVTGALGGGAINAADAGLRGESPITGAQIGLAGGALGPLLGEGFRAGTSLISDHVFPRGGALNDLSPKAMKFLTDAFAGETPQSLAQAQARQGPAGFLADLTPGATKLAQGISFGADADASAAIREPYRLRATEQGKRIDTALTSAMGPNIDVVRQQQALADARNIAADPLYDQWRSMQVHPTPELKAMIPRLEAAGAFDQAEKLSGITGEPINRNFFTSGPQKAYPTTQTWDYVKQGLDSRIDQAYSAGDKTMARALIGLKQNLIDEVEKTPAGKVWKQARQAFAEPSALIDQISAGRDTFLGGRSGLTADELAQELRGLSRPELMARIQGMRSAASEAMGATAIGDTTLRNKLIAPNNQDKIRLMVGGQKGNDLIDTLQQEKFLGDQRNVVAGGSQTTSNTEAVNALKPPPLSQYNPDFAKPLTLLPPLLREELRPSNIINAWRGRQYGEASSQLSSLLTTPGGARQNDIVAAVAHEARRRAAVAAGSARGGEALAGLISGPVTTTARREIFPAQ